MKEKSESKKKAGLLEKAEKIRQNSAGESASGKISSIDKKDNFKSPKKLKTGFYIFLLCFFVILSIAAGFVVGIKKFTKINYEKSHALIERQLSLCQELVTAKYRYSDIIVVKKSMGFSKSYSIVKYTGLLRAGIADVTEIDYTLSKDGKLVNIKVPKAELLGNDLVSQEVFDEKQSIFVPITTQEIFNEIEDARRETAENVLVDGFLEEARNYAIKIITQSLLAAGFDNVRVN